MAPKKKAKLETPVVTPQQVEAARKVLADEKKKKRVNSNMHYWLEQQGVKANFDAMSGTEKKEFFEKWAAKKLSEGTVTETSSQAYTDAEYHGRAYQWMSKEKMIQELGKTKAENKILYGGLKTQPDPDTGKTDEWSLEYKVWQGEGKEGQKREETHGLSGSKELNGDEEKADAQEDIRAAFESMGSKGSSTGVTGPPAVPIKQEPGTTAGEKNQDGGAAAPEQGYARENNQSLED